MSSPGLIGPRHLILEDFLAELVNGLLPQEVVNLIEELLEDANISDLIDAEYLNGNPVLVALQGGLLLLLLLRVGCPLEALGLARAEIDERLHFWDPQDVPFGYLLGRIS